MATIGGAAGEEAVMAVKAYVLIQTEVGRSAQVSAQVARLEGVIISALDVTGPYDVIVQVEADSIDHLGKMVVSRMQLTEGVTRTLTCPIVNL
jgi:DNA-binding Lrp family transcriptional regulator